jgi:hypothetical protein
LKDLILREIFFVQLTSWPMPVTTFGWATSAATSTPENTALSARMKKHSGILGKSPI